VTDAGYRKAPSLTQELRREEDIINTQFSLMDLVKPTGMVDLIIITAFGLIS
jgi:hypothetical protein